MPIKALTTEQEQTIIGRYLDREAVKDISLDYGVHQDTIYNVLRRNSVPRRTRHDRTFPVNHDSFDDLSEESMYWAGFIAADGNINKGPGNTVSRVLLRLAVKDINHLHKFKEFLNAHQSAVTEYQAKNPTGSVPACRIQIRSKQITDRLTDLGVKGPVLSDELTGSRHFWRGMVDGDGYITSPEASKPKINLVGQKYILEPYQQFLRDTLDLDISILSNGPSSFQVAASGRTGVRVTKHLYEDNVISLDRKQKRAEAYLSRYGF